jgi:hypothetical protein
MMHGILGYADRRLTQELAFRIRAALRANIGADGEMSMVAVRKGRKSLMFLQE